MFNSHWHTHFEGDGGTPFGRLHSQSYLGGVVSRRGELSVVQRDGDGSGVKGEVMTLTMACLDEGG